MHIADADSAFGLMSPCYALFTLWLCLWLCDQCYTRWNMKRYISNKYLCVCGVSVCLYVWAWQCVCVCVCTCVCVFVACVCVCMYACVCVCVHVCVFRCFFRSLLKRIFSHLSHRTQRYNDCRRQLTRLEQARAEARARKYQGIV